MAMLVIVPRSRAEEHESLCAQFEAIPWCRVIIDRRVADRRQERRPWPHDERRHSQRRTGRLDNSPHGIVIFLR
jgi:hypothetical protein